MTELSGENWQKTLDEEVYHRRLFFAKVPFKTDEKFIEKYFSKFGIVDNVNLIVDQNNRSRGYGFVTFTDKSMVDIVMNNRPHDIEGNIIDIRRAIPKRLRPDEFDTFSGKLSENPQQQKAKIKKIYIGAIIESIGEYDLWQYFSAFGKVVNCKVMRDADKRTRGFGFLEFDDYDAVDKVILHEHHVLKKQKLDVKKAVVTNKNTINTPFSMTDPVLPLPNILSAFYRAPMIPNRMPFSRLPKGGHMFPPFYPFPIVTPHLNAISRYQTEMSFMSPYYKNMPNRIRPYQRGVNGFTRHSAHEGSARQLSYSFPPSKMHFTRKPGEVRCDVANWTDKISLSSGKRKQSYYDQDFDRECDMPSQNTKRLFSKTTQRNAASNPFNYGRDTRDSMGFGGNNSGVSDQHSFNSDNELFDDPKTDQLPWQSNDDKMESRSNIMQRAMKYHVRSEGNHLSNRRYHDSADQNANVLSDRYHSEYSHPPHRRGQDVLSSYKDVSKFGNQYSHSNERGQHRVSEENNMYNNRYNKSATSSKDRERF